MLLQGTELRSGDVGQYRSAVLEVHVRHRKSGVSFASVPGNAGSAATGMRGRPQEGKMLRATSM